MGPRHRNYQRTTERNRGFPGQAGARLVPFFSLFFLKINKSSESFWRGRRRVLDTSMYTRPSPGQFPATQILQERWEHIVLFWVENKIDLKIWVPQHEFSMLNRSSCTVCEEMLLRHFISLARHPIQIYRIPCQSLDMRFPPRVPQQHFK